MHIYIHIDWDLRPLPTNVDNTNPNTDGTVHYKHVKYYASYYQKKHRNKW